MQVVDELRLLRESCGRRQGLVLSSQVRPGMLLTETLAPAGKPCTPMRRVSGDRCPALQGCRSHQHLQLPKGSPVLQVAASWHSSPSIPLSMEQGHLPFSSVSSVGETVPFNVSRF